MPAAPFKLTLATKAVLCAFLADPQAELYGITLSETVGLPSGTIHPILARLQKHGWLQSRWTQPQGHVPPRRYYRFTGHGAQQAAQLAAQLHIAGPGGKRMDA